MYTPQCFIDIYWSTVSYVQRFPPYPPRKGHYCLGHDNGLQVPVLDTHFPINQVS